MEGSAWVEAILARAEERPDAIAIDAGHEQLSYGALAQASAGLAAQLTRLGAVPEVLVAVGVERSLELVVALLAVSRSGSAYLPLDPGYPVDRVAAMLDGASPPLLIAPAEVAERWFIGDSKRVEVDLGSWLAASGHGSQPALIPAESLAYVLFTSGSTGRPKGVMIPHRALANHMAWMGERFPLETSDRVLLKTSISFDASVWEVWAPMLAGARLVLAAPGEERDALRLLDRIERHGATVLQAVPTLLEALLQTPRPGRAASLRRCFCGGESLTESLRDRWQAALPIPLINLYGPTETTIEVSFAEYPAGSRGPVSLGGPITNTRLSVVEPSGALAAGEKPGELWIGGAGVGRGYLRQPAATAERFVPDPWGEPGSRCYRSGDRVRWRPPGSDQAPTLEYLGRIDQQVKVLGLRLELGEVEAALESEAEIDRAVVLVRTNGSGSASLVAFLVAKPGTAVDLDELTRRLKARLLGPMVPATWVRLDALPLAPNGKVDRRALAALAESRVVQEPSHEIAPEAAGLEEGSSATEALVAHHFRRALGHGDFGLDDPFFFVGGHSLSANLMLARLAADLGRELPEGLLFEAPSVRELARHLDGAEPAGATAAPLVAVDRSGPLPLTYPQQSLWLLEKLEPGSSRYHLPSRWRIDGRLDAVALARAYERLFERHEGLRSRITQPPAEAGTSTPGLVQWVAPVERFRLPVIDLSRLGPSARERSAGSLAEAEARATFDLGVPPLLRARLLRLTSRRHQLLETLHHAVGDAWASRLLHEELGALYTGLALAPPTLQQGDYAVWQRASVPSFEAEELEIWRRTLEDLSPFELPPDRPRADSPRTPGGARLHLVLARVVSEKVLALAKEEATTPFVVLLTAFAATLARLSGERRLLLGTLVARRDRPETLGLVADLVNMVALACDLRGNPTARELVARTKALVEAALTHSRLPFERLVEALEPERRAGRNPLCQVTFETAAEAPDQRLPAPRLGALAVQTLPSPTVDARFDLEVLVTTVLGREAGFTVEVDYSPALYDESTIERLLRRFEAAAGEITEQPERRWGDLDLLLSGERDALARALPPATRLEAEPLERQLDRVATSHRDAVALVFGQEQLSYEALWLLARRWAAALVERGVRPEVRVALEVEREPWQIGALLAVMLAGGASVPIDPAAPEARRRALLADGGASLLLGRRRQLAGTSAPPIPAVALEDLDLEARRRDPLTPPTAPLADSLLYVIFTSGSTGRPKGVGVSRRSAALFLGAMVESYELTAGDRALQFAASSFDASVEEIYGPLLVGARLVLREADWLTTLERLTRRAEEQRITLLNLPTALWHELSRELAAGQVRLPRSTRQVVIGGERALPERIRDWWRTVGERPALANAYGPTEGTVGVTVGWLEAGADGEGRLTLGRPLASASLAILDPELSPPPPGAPGELWLGGAALARGYLGAPAATADRFRPDPASRVAGGRRYRTGDRVRLAADGQIEFLGRADGQVKVRGVRIELGEVEAALATLPGVVEVVVLAVPEPGGGTALAGFYSGAAEAPDEAQVLRELATRLPAALVPAALRRLESWPLLASGKVDRRRLAALARELPRSSAPAVEPADELEAELAAVWAEAFGAPVAVGESFVALGGHSLLATRLLSAMAQRFGLEMSFGELLSASVVSVARRLRERDQPLEHRPTPLSGLEAAASSTASAEAPASFAQRRLWFLAALSPGQVAYHLPEPLRLRGRLVPSALGRALGRLVERHEALRTVFSERDGEPWQHVRPAGRFVLPLVDLGGLDPIARQARGSRLAHHEERRPFDLCDDAMLRAVLVREEAEHHLLLLTFHHIAADGASINLAFVELGRFYREALGGEQANPPALPMSYRDYARWHRARLEQVEAAELAFWRPALAELPELSLPFDRPRRGGEEAAAGLLHHPLPAGVLEHIQALSSRLGATPFMVLLAAFQAFLGRLTGERDLAVGTPLGNRPLPELQNLVGFFVNLAVLRTRLGAGATLAEQAEATKATVLAALAHPNLPFERLVEALNPERELGKNALCQVTFQLFSEPHVLPELPGVEVAELGRPIPAARFDLELLAFAEGQGRLEVNYRRDLFDRTTVTRWLAGFIRLLATATSDPEIPLESVVLLSPAERAAVVVEWNDTGAPRPEALGIEQLLARRAEENPDRIALDGGRDQWSHGHFAARVERGAQRLLALGVGPECLVGVLQGRSPEAVAAMASVMAAGGAYVPLDSGTPLERLRLIAQDAALTWLLTDSQHAELAGAVVAGTATNVLAAADVDPPRHAASPAVCCADALAYVIYTSGSTGKPKGVGISRRSLLHFAAWHLASFAVSAADRQAYLANAGFDASVWDLWPVLSAGGSVALAPEEVRTQPEALVRWLTERAVTLSFVTTALGELLLEEVWPAEARLSRLLVGGDRLKTYPRPGLPFEAFNVYGPTETTVATVATRLQPAPLAPPGLPPIGRPIRGSQTWVLDRSFEPVGVGVAGELAIGGGGVGRGYLGRPALTASRFLPAALAPEGGARLYLTGDRVRFLPDGTIDFLGRVDFQVKIRGFRIELGEIEAALLADPRVSEAVVVARAEPSGATALVGYVASREAAEPARFLADLHRRLSETLPAYMVPRQVVALAALPKNASGKLDRKALPETGFERGGWQTEFAAPATATEAALAAIWSEVLGVEAVGRHDRFFDLGGHSLLATRVLSRLRRAFEVELPVKTFFTATSLSALAEAIDLRRADRAQGATTTLPPLSPEPRPEFPPLSFAQQRLWILNRLAGPEASYNTFTPIWLRGPLDVARLVSSFGDLVARHEVLRTSFPLGPEGEPYQRVESPAWARHATGLAVIELSALRKEDQRLAVEALAVRDARAPFDLSTPPLFKSRLLRLERHHHLWFRTLHHILTDGWSEEVVDRDFAAFYEGRELAPLPVQYLDFALWQRRWLPGAELERQLAYWKQRLAGLPALLEFPTDRPRPAIQSFRGNVCCFRMEQGLTERLRALARAELATPFMVFAAGWQLLLSRLSGQRDLALGSVVAGRNQRAVEDLVGFFVNTLVLRGDLGGRPDFSELLARVKKTALEAFAHQDVPFEKLVDELKPERNLSHHPLFQAMYSLESSPPRPPRLMGIETELLELGGTPANFDLTLIVHDFGTSFEGQLLYNVELFDRTTLERQLGQLVTLLDAASREPHRPVATLALLSPPEKQQIVLEWNNTATDWTTDETPTLEAWFERRVDFAPDAVALSCDDDRLCYAEVEARANRLAHQLAAAGITRGKPVGLWMTRSTEMVVAMLAAVKTGGYYLPLDAAWPAHRVEHILRANAVTTLVTSRVLLPAVAAMEWSLPALATVICPDLETENAPVEELDTTDVEALWDFVAQRATDRVSAGGFVSSFTGQAFREEEVDEYVGRVLELAAPYVHGKTRVLEIGCGAGLILFELAPRVASYVGLDPSPKTQEKNRLRKEALGLSQVVLETGFAHQLDGHAAASFDLILMPSVAQFFPGPRYFDQVVARAAELLAPGGALVLADLPNTRRKKDLEAAVAAYREAHPELPPPPASGERRELHFDPAMIADLPARVAGLGSARVEERTVGFDNELRFRFDAVLEAAYEGAGPGAAGQEPAKRLVTGWHLRRRDTTRPPRHHDADDLAYIIHTSGSTGAPKGIAVTHRPVANLFEWLNPAFEVNTTDRLLFITSPCFDLSVYDVFGVLAAGAEVRIATEDEIGDAQRLARKLEREGITIWDSAPAALAQLAPLLPLAREAGEPGPLRLVMLSGDWIPVPLPDRLRASFPKSRVMALGGATEATVWSNWFPVGVVEPGWPSIPYGRPIANARYRVLDGELGSQPVGVPGDLLIGGEVLCLGYWGQPGLTAERFIPDPDPNARPGDRLYRTGDRARLFTDGNLEFLGRLDHQVKIRGFRIELGEIEVALARHPALAQALVIAREDGARPGERGDKRLVAYVVAEGDAEAPPPEELRTFLKKDLPDYMVPAAFVVLPVLPVTANGKLDRAALPAPRREDTSAEAGFAAPETALERQVAALFAEVLGLERVGLSDDFFALGGHSLLATQLVVRLRSSLGLELPLVALFEAPTVAGVVSRLAEAEAAKQPSRPPLVRQPEGADARLSASQFRLWFLSQLEPGTTAFHVPVGLELDGPLDPRALARAVATVVARHQAFRTRFVGEPRPEVVDSLHLPLPVVDLDALGAAAGVTTTRLARALDTFPFDLAVLPLLRWVLVRAGSERAMFLASIHHIVFDGWSQGVLVRDLAAAYEAWLGGQPPRLPELPIEPTDYAAWQQGWLESPSGAAMLEAWRPRLFSLPEPLALPFDRPRPSLESHRGAYLDIELPGSVAAVVRERVGRGDLTLFMVLLAGWQALLARLSGAKEFFVGTYVANRGDLAVEGLVGFFVNTLLLPADLAGDPSGEMLLSRVKAGTIFTFERQELPYEKLLEVLPAGPGRGAQGAAPRLFDVLFGLQNFSTDPATGGGLTLRPTDSFESHRAASDLALWWWEKEAESGPSRITGLLQYATDLFDEATARRVARQVPLVLEALLRDPRRQLSTLPLLAAVERHQLLHEWSHREPPGDSQDVVEAIRRQVSRHPDAVALVAGDEQLSYAELGRRVDVLAEELEAWGAGPETVVAVCLPRGLEAPIALLATLTAGAAYLPLDPTHPQERRDLMIEDAGAILVLSAAGLESAGEGFAPGGPYRRGLHAEQLAYVIYTSGSTGRPKGVGISRRALSSFVAATVRGYGLGPSDRVLQFASLSFDASVEEIYPCWVAGGRLVLRTDELIATMEGFVDAVDAWGLTVLDLPTAFWHEWVAAIESRGLSVPASVRLTILGGERAAETRVESWHLHLSGRSTERRPTLVNSYGPTETTVVATLTELRPRETGAASIGRAISGGSTWVVDPSLVPTPIGVPGELLLGGDHLARGYLERPALTAERFVPALAGPPGARLYRSGDLARYAADGRLEFLGRCDEQVKIRGFRVEPGEVAALLAAHPAVVEAVVLPFEGAGGGLALAAYVVPATPLERSELVEFLKQQLPAYMVPSAFHLLDALPKTAAGKIDRRALPEAFSGDGAGGGVHPEAPPTTPTEELLVGLWSELLGQPTVGIYSNFFDLGGHSLLVPQLISRLADTFAVRLPLATFMTAPTVAQLAVALEEQLLAEIEALSEEEVEHALALDAN